MKVVCGDLQDQLTAVEAAVPREAAEAAVPKGASEAAAEPSAAALLESMRAQMEQMQMETRLQMESLREQCTCPITLVRFRVNKQQGN